MKKLFLAVFAVALLAVPAATAARGERPAAAESSIVQTAIAVNSSGPYAGQFDTLICLVANNPTVLNLLSQRGQYTVFAPTNAAFAQIGVTSANCATVAPDVTGILAYHVAKGRRAAADVVSSTQIRMLNRQFTSISAAGGSYYINDAKIIATDVFASNGVIHAIDKVLLPS
ncbi:MAG TPA: fasciclin domain-containing protein [Gaiellaceae bacterium]|nr:fasciclin domain-containing protein [Gaiellaceae bacterium]